MYEPPEASPLFAACDPTGDGSTCTAGLTCFARHTDPSWYDADVFGRCVIPDCVGGIVSTCEALDGTCACPIYAGGPDCTGVDGGPVDVSALVCIPIPRR